LVSEETVLDVGCGDKPHGTVNCDIYKYLNPQILANKNTLTPMDHQHIRNFILCDGEYLPFKNKSFDIAYSSHTIEHCEKPTKFIKEMIRVARKEVVIVCPHRFNRGAKGKYHKHYFNVKWFSKVLKNYVYDIEQRFRPFLPFLAYEIRVRIVLRGSKYN